MLMNRIRIASLLAAAQLATAMPAIDIASIPVITDRMYPSYGSGRRISPYGKTYRANGWRQYQRRERRKGLTTARQQKRLRRQDRILLTMFDALPVYTAT